MRVPCLGLALAAAACGPGVEDSGEAGPALRTWLEGSQGAGGILVVQVEAPADAGIQLDEPRVEGLSFQPSGPPVTESLGDRVVVTRRFRFAGDEGSYEIPALEATWTGPSGEGVLRSVPLWVDLGVTPPREGDLADIDEPGPVWRPPWGLLSVLGGVGLLLGGVTWYAWRGSWGAPPPPPPTDPPDVRALRAWDAARADPNLDDHGRALAISRIFRRYAEEVLAFPATSWTTTETLAHLKGLAHLAEGNVPRAKNLLRATDRVKFADAGATAELFESLDADLRAFVASTAPRLWDGGGAR